MEAKLFLSHFPTVVAWCERIIPKKKGFDIILHQVRTVGRCVNMCCHSWPLIQLLFEKWQRKIKEHVNQFLQILYTVIAVAKIDLLFCKKKGDSDDNTTRKAATNLLILWIFFSFCQKFCGEGRELSMSVAK